jgi:outer membrane protein OmpA-like peptidoglycan-associated protein
MKGDETMSFFKTVIAGVVAAMILAPAALAQDLTADEATDVIRSLAPKTETATSPQPRVKLEVAQRVIVIDPSRALDFEVYFEFDSARLTPL